MALGIVDIIGIIGGRLNGHFRHNRPFAEN